MLEAIKSIKPWQIAVLVVIPLVAFGVAYGVYSMVSGSGQADLGEDQQTIPVIRGDLVNDVSINGSLVYPERDTLTFGVQGTVGDVPVEKGQEVEKEQALAALDPETVATLERAVARARVDLRDAEDALGEALAPYTPLDVAQAEATVANASLSLDDALEALDRLVHPTSLEIAQSEATVSSARLSLDSAQEALDRLLEPTSQEIALAEAAVAGARVSLDNAQAALDGLLEPSSQDIAQAEAGVSSARLSRDSALEALDRLLKPTSQDVAQAEAAVAGARVSLEVAREALGRLLEPTPEDVATAEGRVIGARLAVDAASAALDDFKAGAGEDDIAQAQSQVDSAQTALDGAGGDLELTQKEWVGRLEVAQDAAENAQEEYQAVFARWLGIELGEAEAGTDPDALLESWAIDLVSLFDPDSRYFDIGKWLFTQGLPTDDSATPWDEQVVYIWLNLSPGEIVDTCDDGAVPFQGWCVKKEMDDGWILLDAAVDNLDTVTIQAAKAVDNAQAAVTHAKDTLEAALDAMADLMEPADPLEIESRTNQLALAMISLETAEDELATLSEPDQAKLEEKRKQVALAEANLDEEQEALAELIGDPDPLDVGSAGSQVALAQANLDEAETELAELAAELGSPEVDAATSQVAVAQANLEEAEEDLAELTIEPDAAELDAARSQVDLARANLDDAEADLAEIKGEPDPVELEAKQRQVAVASASLAEAEDDLAEMKAGVDSLEVALREADLESARTALETAVLQLDDATIEAPWGGVVWTVNVEVGQAVNANTPIVEIVDTTVVEVTGIVDEIDVLYIREGADATVTMDAIPGQTLNGTVSEIAVVAQGQQGVVSYPVSIRLEPPQELGLLPEGLSAIASVILREDRDVLLVPLDALYGTYDQPIVRVTNGGGVEDREVILGNSDDFWVVVQSGLIEAELVVMEVQTATASGFEAMRGLIGGGGFRPPGGGGFRPSGGGGAGGGR